MPYKPATLATRIFLDSGDPNDTKKALDLLGFLDGQTTNPSLVAKHPTLQQKIAAGSLLEKQEVNNFYKGVIQEISALIPHGSISIEVYADNSTTANDMLTQAKEMNTWIPNAHIKFPTTTAGLEAAHTFVNEHKGRVNMTLVFSQQQAAAVYAATQGAHKGDVFLSPFVGRLDDKGINGMSFIQNCIDLYKASDHHVEILVASVRNMNHFLYSIALGADIITAPLSILEEWAHAGMPIPDKTYNYQTELTNMPVESIDLQLPWKSFDIQHKLTTAGIEKFVSDWNKLIGT